MVKDSRTYHTVVTITQCAQVFVCRHAKCGRKGAGVVRKEKKKVIQITHVAELN